MRRMRNLDRARPTPQENHDENRDCVHRIAKDADGTFVRKIQKVVFADHADAYAGECKMK